jgi:hypothetical protein
MKQKHADPMEEDSFEKARRAFFGTAKTSPEANASSADFFQPRNELPSQEVAGPSSQPQETVQPLVLAPHGLADFKL